MYPQGYFHQHVSADGWQQEVYERLDWLDAPIEPAVRADGTPCVVAVPLGDRTVLAAVWVVRAGRVEAATCSTPTCPRTPRGTANCRRGSTAATRRRASSRRSSWASAACARSTRSASQPTVWHLNEGHAAFVVLQRIREFARGRAGRSTQAVAEVRRTTVFTTHTPVPAGHDAFPFHLVETYLAGAWGSLGDLRDQFLALGAYDNGNGNGPLFNMTALALRSAGRASTRSASCTATSRARCGRRSGRSTPAGQEPVRDDHQRRARADVGRRRSCRSCSRRTSRPTGAQRHDDPADVGRDRTRSPTRNCGRSRQALRNYLFAFIRERARQRWTERARRPRPDRRGGHAAQPRRADHRVRAAVHRLQAPGAAVPRPRPPRPRSSRRARSRCRSSSPASRTRPTTRASTTCSGSTSARWTTGFGGRIAFIDDYDLHVAHFLVQGCDVWLNTPRKPLEASGTSGMKAAVNGVPQPEHRRRLVGRGLQRRRTAG